MKARTRLIVLRTAIRRSPARTTLQVSTTTSPKKPLATLASWLVSDLGDPRTYAFGASSSSNRRHATAAFHPEPTPSAGTKRQILFTRSKSDNWYLPAAAGVDPFRTSDRPAN